ncbi:adenylate/guanylate cyclase domain-containing protein [Leptolyngbya ohadii]|uniref:adenylate/guanylate cyclase domain-containing protein n=1 Tax=Leptolyngbya ohadii TaxID=1962290 RepID=UPI000B5A1F21|nr:adenylate/guanylate cyclase domain-containing protein [Leptolyngbya ohadii]
MVKSDVSSSLLTSLAQIDRAGSLTDRMQALSLEKFQDLLEKITGEFQHFLKAIELINDETLETMLEQILQAFTLKIGQLLRADRTTIFLVDLEKEQLWSKVAQGSDGKPTEIRVPLRVGIAGHVASTGECLNIHDAYEHPLFNPEVDRQTQYRTRNILCMPVFSSDRQVVAVVQLLNKQQGNFFDAEDERLFREFAESMGIILESCNSFYIAARNQRGVAALLKATSSLGQSLDLDKTLRVVMEEARTLMQADRSTLFLLDHDKNELWSKIAKADGESLIEIRIPANRGIAGYVASTKLPLNVPDAYEDPRFDSTIDRKTGYRTRSILCMPIFNSEGDLIGVTQLINKLQGTFNASDEKFMQAFNIQAGVALENAQLFQSVMQEKQYQKDILQSLSDAVISTNTQGEIVTINEAALRLLGCLPPGQNAAETDQERQNRERQAQRIWQQRLVGQLVWNVVPIDHLQFRLQDSLTYGAKHYVPEQTLRLSDSALWQQYEQELRQQPTERSINLTVNPLTNPEGEVRGGLVVLEDISQEKRMKATMYRYMTPSVAERVMMLGENALMGGERKDVTILFSDIRGYTSLTEKMEAPEVVSLLNHYFETMVEAVFNYEGTLDKFIGDALMAVFGAPLPIESHAWKSVQSALDMRRRLAEFNHDRLAVGHQPLRIGIGISSGEVVSGSIGSQRLMNYTVIGDGVDVSSRLEGITKEYGCDIILSEYTYRLCSDKIWARELDRIRVKGKTRPVLIYELLGDRRQPLDLTTQDFLQVYQAGRTAYSNGCFAQAIDYFTQAKRLKGFDPATENYLQRSQKHLLNPPTTWEAG